MHMYLSPVGCFKGVVDLENDSVRVTTDEECDACVAVPSAF